MTSLPPPAPGKPATLDFGRPFLFWTRDPEWVTKTLIGGLFSLLGVLIIGYFFVVGYLAQLARNVAAGAERPLPAWDRLGDYFVEGLKLFLLSLVYLLPLILVIGLLVVPIALLDDTAGEELGGTMAGCMVCLVVPLALLISAIMPAAFTLAAVRGSAAAFFDFSAIFAFIKVNFVNYVLSILVYIIANFLSQVGVVGLCIGIFWTTFISLVITTFSFAETYRLSPVK